MVILWNKMPLSRALACGLEDDTAGRQMPPRHIPSQLYARLQHAGNPRLGGKGNVERNLTQPLAMKSQICYNSVISLSGWHFYGNRTEDQSRQVETAHEPDGVCAAF